MLADKTLLSVTLAATFASGTFVGYAMRGASHDGAPGIGTQAAYAPQLAELRAKGYDDAEMAEASQVYADYMKGYEKWWNAFLDVQQDNLNKIDETLEKRLGALEAKHRERGGAK